MNSTPPANKVTARLRRVERRVREMIIFINPSSYPAFADEMIQDIFKDPPEHLKINGTNVSEAFTKHWFSEKMQK